MNKVGWKLGQKNEVKMEQENLVTTLPTKEALLASLVHLQKLRQTVGNRDLICFGQWPLKN